MRIDADKVLFRADELYMDAQAEKYPYMAPELLVGGIRSNQVKALLQALCEAINDAEVNDG